MAPMGVKRARFLVYELAICQACRRQDGRARVSPWTWTTGGPGRHADLGLRLSEDSCGLVRRHSILQRRVQTLVDLPGGRVAGVNVMELADTASRAADHRPDSDSVLMRLHAVRAELGAGCGVMRLYLSRLV